MAYCDVVRADPRDDPYYQPPGKQPEGPGLWLIIFLTLAILAIIFKG